VYRRKRERGGGGRERERRGEHVYIIMIILLLSLPLKYHTHMRGQKVMVGDDYIRQFATTYVQVTTIGYILVHTVVINTS
jgi:hypothetical protein